ncbi:MAG TPA: ATP-dependent DNA helicase, partial [Terriglobales bacterium]|nr:ATP-dependent DNA helicase [Terriglobales bacterium]
MTSSGTSGLAKTPNPKQEIAISHIHGPMLVRAGAGTGKTTVLVERAVRLLVGKHAKPSQILAVTYTREAARQLHDRIRARVEAECGLGSAEGLRATTFHACAYEILEKNNQGFDVLDRENLWVVLRREIDARRVPLRKFLRAADPAKFLDDILKFLDRCSDELVDAGSYRAYVERVKKGELPLPRVYSNKESENISREEILERCDEVADVFAYVEDLLHRKKSGTYGAMIVRAVELLRSRPEVLAAEQARTSFLLVDEFQDCNLGQIELTELLGGKQQNIFAVGDPDQIIYRFRGASSAAFDEFLARFPATKAVTLEENYRSTAAILKIAHGVIHKNPDIASSSTGPMRRPLVSARSRTSGLKGSVPEAVLSHGNEHSAYHVAMEIQRLQQQGAKWSDFAALYRSHGHSQELIVELGGRGIPFVVAGIDLFKTAMLRDLLALMRVLDSGADDISLFRLSLRPQAGIDLNELQHRMRHANRTNLAAVLEPMGNGKRLLLSIQELRKSLPSTAKVSRAVKECAKYLGLDVKREEYRCFAEFVKKWEKLHITETGLLPEFLVYLDYFTRAGGCLKAEEEVKADAVRLMSVHSAKGLEFPHVFVLRVCSPSFPGSYKPPLFEFPNELLGSKVILTHASSEELHEQEERRLFYVAVTRAKDTLSLHSGVARGKDLVPTRYLRELRDEHKEQPVLEFRNAMHFRSDMSASAAPEPLWLTVRTDTKVKPELSDYAIGLYEKCPLRFRLDREWRLPAEPAAAMQFGAAMHRVLSDYVRSMMAKRAYSEAQVLELFRKELKEARIENPLQHELYEHQGTEQLRRFLSSLPPSVETLSTETTFAVEIGGVTIKGRIDRLDQREDGTVEVVDYKTGSPKDEKFAKKSLQLAIYALALQKQGKHRPSRLTLHNLEDGSRAEIPVDPKQLQRAE